jgi:hypothetical protein
MGLDSGVLSNAFVLFRMIILSAKAYQLLTAFILFLEITCKEAVLLTYDIPFHYE